MAVESIKGFKLGIPLDASQVVGYTPDQPLKVAIRKRDGSVEEAVVKLDKAGQGTAALSFAEHPGGGRITIGPAEASAEELFALQTLTVDVPAKQWGEKRELLLPPIRIPPYYWHWWRRWCRKFTIRGRVVCQDGVSPVPGATVCAYDVDWWFFWRSRQLIGCATTDVDGTFEMNFRWCCGWWPWWWWQHRVWEIDSEMLERIRVVLQSNPALRLGRVGDQPSLAVFADILGKEIGSARKPLSAEDVAMLQRIRPTLLKKLPLAPDLEGLHVWPWWPWRPWWDCTPDTVFKVTQNCLTPGAVIYTEGIGATRWNIANPLDVTLMANDKACCRLIPQDPPGEPEDCLVIERVCNAPITNIGGNYSAAVTPAGYLNPGTDDRPFAGQVVVERDFKDLATVDYLEVECSSGGAAPQPVEALYPGSLVDFNRLWMEMVPGYPTGYPLFKWEEKNGHTVVETREHYENDPVHGWNPNKWWLAARDVVFVLDSSKFPDGTYTFQVVGWREGAGGTLVQVGKGALPLCGNTPDLNKLVLTFDNRLENDPAHPTSATHPCGSGTVHFCVTEPDTDFILVKVGGKEVGPCDVVNRLSTELLEIEFMAHDPDGHLWAYELHSTYRESLAVDLLQGPGRTLTCAAGEQIGPTYTDALAQGAAAPEWHGSRSYKVTVPVSVAFPEPCCYQLELRAYKRTVVNCSTESDYHYAHHWNLSQYNLGVGVCPPLPVVTPLS